MDKKIQFGKTVIGDSLKTNSIDSAGIRTNSFEGGNSFMDSKPYGIFNDTPIHEISLPSTVITPGIPGGISLKAFVYLKNFYERFDKLSKKINKFANIFGMLSDGLDEYDDVEFNNRAEVYEKISKGWNK